MRLSRLLFNEPKWHKFFGGEYNVKTDYVRCMKEVFEPNNKVVLMILDAGSRDFSDLDDSDMLAILARYKLVTSQLMRYKKDGGYLKSLIYKLHERLELENSINWTPKKLDFFFNYFHNTQDTFFNVYQRSTLDSLLDHTLTLLDDFSIVELGSSVRCLHPFPLHYEAFYAKLLGKFNSRTDFSLLSSTQLATIASSLFVRYDVFGSSLPVLMSDLNPESYAAFEAEAMRKIKKELWISSLYVPISESIANLVPRSQVFSIFLVELLTDVADVENDNIDEKLTESLVLPPLRLLKAVDPSHPEFEVLLHKVTAVLFVKHVFQKSVVWSAMFNNLRCSFFVNYLMMAASRNLFQVVFLDLTVSSLEAMMQSKRTNLSLSQLSQMFSSLAHLNYPGRFNINLPFKQDQHQKWEDFLTEGKKQFLRLIHTQADDEEYLNEVELQSLQRPKHHESLIDFLWAMCVFEVSDHQLFTATLGLVKPQECSEVHLARLMQIHYYLTYEKPSESKLPEATLAFLQSYKQKWNFMQTSQTGGELHQAIKHTLESQQIPYLEHVRDFPYILSFVASNSSQAIQVDDVDAHFEGSEVPVKSGAKRLETRQLAYLGWQVKRHSFKTWVISGHMQGFSSS
jgi:hypothetical protein